MPGHSVRRTDLPVVPQAEFRRADSRRDNRLLTAPLDEAVVFRSGGTTGSPEFSCYTRTEWREFTTASARDPSRPGCAPGHRVADLFYAGDLYASFRFVPGPPHRSPVANVRLPIGGAAPWESSAATLEEFGARVVAGTPTTPYSLAERLATAGRAVPDVELPFFGGECPGLLTFTVETVPMDAFEHTPASGRLRAVLDLRQAPAGPAPPSARRAFGSWSAVAHPAQDLEGLREQGVLTVGACGAAAAPGAQDGADGSQSGAGDDRGMQVGIRCLLGQPVEDQGGETVLELGEGLDQPCGDQLLGSVQGMGEGGEAGAPEGSGRGQQGAAHGVEGRLVNGPPRQGLFDRGEEFDAVGQKEILFAVEVAEEGAGGHVRAGGDVGDGGVGEAAFGEEPGGAGAQLPASLVLLAFPQP